MLQRKILGKNLVNRNAYCLKTTPPPGSPGVLSPPRTGMKANEATELDRLGLGVLLSSLPAMPDLRGSGLKGAEGWMRGFNHESV